MTSGGTLVISGTVTITQTGGTWTPGTGTVNFSGTQTLPTSWMLTYNNLTISGSGTKTISTGITVNGILSMQDTAPLSTSGTLTYGSAATLQYNTSSARTAGPEWPQTFSAAGGVVFYNTRTIKIIQSKIFRAGVPRTIYSGGTGGESAGALGGRFCRAPRNRRECLKKSGIHKA
jgi:hypothetical protein